LRNYLIAILTFNDIIYGICVMLYLGTIELYMPSFYLLLLHSAMFLLLFVKAFLKIHKCSSSQEIKEVWMFSIAIPLIIGIGIGINILNYC
jgi:hypothetical protein